MSLNVLHISESDVGGGAALAAYRLHSALREEGHESRMLVGRRLSDSADVRPLKRNVAWRAADRAFGELAERASLQYVFFPSSFGVARDPWFRGADVVQLHNLHGSYFSYTALPLLSRRRPVVWLLHDLWALTGHVAYPLDCERWQSGCGTCPYLREYPALRRDTTALLWRLKRLVYRRSRLTLVTPSSWLADRVRESPLLSGFDVQVIRNGVELGVFRPRPRDEARRMLSLSPDRRIVLFAASDLGERRKGLHLLVEALRGLEDPPLLVLAGGGAAHVDGVESVALGPIDDPERLASAYAAADVFAVPTLADVLTQTAPEALACGTPCLAFDRGGITDVVRDGETGLQASFGDVGALARALRGLLDDDELRARLGRRCREVAEEDFAIERQARRYVTLYEEVLAAR